MEFGHLEGGPQPQLGDLRSPWLLTTYKSWDDPGQQVGGCDIVPPNMGGTSFLQWALIPGRSGVVLGCPVGS